MNATKSDASPTMESRFVLLESGIDRLNESLDKKYSELSAKLSVMVKTPKLMALADDVKKLKESVNQRCSGMESRLEAVRTAEDIKQLWERCAELDTKITTATSVWKSPVEEERIESLESEVEQIRLTLDQTVAEHDCTAIKDDAEENYIASLAENVLTLQETLEKKFSNLDNELSLMVKAPKLQSVADDLKRLRDEVAGVNSCSSWQEVLDQRTVDLNTRLDDSIKAIKGELVTEIAKVSDTVSERIHALQADLGSTTSKNKLDLEELNQQMQHTSMSCTQGANASLLQVDDQLASIVQDVNLLRKSLDSRYEDLSGRVDADIGRLQTCVEEVAQLAKKVNTSIEGVDLASNSARLNALTGTVELLQKNVNTKLGGIPARAPVQSAEDDDRFTALWAEDLQNLQRSLEERYEEIESKLGLTTAALGEFRQRFESDIMDVNESLEDLAQQTNGLAAVVESPKQERDLMMPMDTKEAESCRAILGQWQHEVHGESRTFTIQLRGGRPVFNQIVLSGGLQHKLEGVLVPEEEIEGIRYFRASLNVVDSNAFAGTVQLHHDAAKNSIISHFIKPSGETLDTCSVQVRSSMDQGTLRKLASTQPKKENNQCFAWMLSNTDAAESKPSPGSAMIGESGLETGQDGPIRKTDSPQEKNELMASLTTKGARVIATQPAQGLWKRKPESRGLSTPLASINEQGTSGFDEENAATSTSSVPPVSLILVRRALALDTTEDEPFQAFLRQQRHHSEVSGKVDSRNPDSSTSQIDEGVPWEITEDHINLVRQSLALVQKKRDDIAWL